MDNCIEKNADDVVKIYRYPFVTYLTDNFFGMLKKLISQVTEQLTSASKDKLSVYQLYQILIELKVIKCNLKALSFCSL